MKTLEEVIARGSQCIDGRDFSRLASYMTVEQIKAAEMSFNNAEDEKAWVPKDWTRENIIEQLTNDLDFGFEKALDQRGISAGLMLEVVAMWVFALDDEGIRDFDFESNYAQYGLPGLKAVAVHYNLPNPIGDDTGTEQKYSS